MDEDFINQIEKAEAPPELKVALSSYFQVYESVKPELPRNLQHLCKYWLSSLLDQAFDPSAETHWWETLLCLLDKELEPLGKPGRRLMTAGEQLRPHLAAHLGPYTDVTLREITAETVRTICKLTDTLVPPQDSMVAPNAVSLAQALFSPQAWYRAIYAGKQAVGFLMLYDDPDKPEYFLWRFMIARPCQGRGYGAQAIQRLVEYVHTRPNASELGVSCELGPGSPEPFYVKHGFVSTGEFLGDELVLKMRLD